jgi:hypothetical protein
MTLNLAVGAATLAIGIFLIASPAEAARIWGWRSLDRLNPSGRTFYFRCYRVLGVLLALAGILFVGENTSLLR